MLDNQKFGKRLVQAGVISQAQLDEALRQQQVQEGRLGEILVRLGYVSEPTVLQFLAAEFRTRYVSTERLAKARIPQQVLDLLPVHIAERYNLIPVLFDSENSTLSIVTSDPQNEASLREVHMITRVRELRVYVALQSAVQAAIRKHYRGEINAFNQVQQNQSYPSTPGYEPASENAGEYGYENPDATMYVAPGVGADYLPGGAGSSLYTPSGGNVPYDPQDASYGISSNPPSSIQIPYAENQYAPRASYETPPPYSYDQNNYNYNQTPGIANNYTYSDSYSSDYDDDDVTKLHSVNPGIAAYSGENSSFVEPSNATVDYATTTGTDPRMKSISPLAQVQLLPLIKMLAERVERNDPRYAEHLTAQEPLLGMMLKRLGVNSTDCDAIWLAFYLHHINLPNPHPCLLSLAQNDEILQQAMLDHEESITQLQHYQLPPATMEILQHFYERFNGEGFPEKLSGTSIPIGSRLLALLDTYEDLRFQDKAVEADEIVERLRMHENKLFDPDLLDLFEKELFRIEKFNKGTIPRILLLDPDVESTSELEQQLLSRGFWVQIFHEPELAIDSCKKELVDLVVLEIDFSGKMDGFSFVETVKEVCNKVPEFLFVTNQNDSEKLEKGMSLARDFLIKSMGANIIVTKINKQIQQLQRDKKLRESAAPRTRRGLEGALEEMGPPDILQVLSQSRRTGKLALRHEDRHGAIFLDQGQVVNAKYQKLKGEPAFYKMIGWEKGEFQFEPGIQIDERLINAPLDGLILDGLRMLDEFNRDGGDPFGDDGEDEFGDFELGDGDSSSKEEEPRGEDDFFDLSFDDADEKSPEATPPKKEETSKPDGGGLDGLFDDLNDNDLDSVFSSGFGGKQPPKS